MKVVWIGDVHFKGKKPSLRKDKDFFLTIINKLKFAISQGDTIFFTGDLFDMPDPSMSIVNLALEFFMTHTKNGKKFYSIAGNHDLFGGNRETIYNTAFGNLLVSGCINLIPPEGLELPGNLPVYVYGYNWGEKITPCTTVSEDRVNIALVHDNYYYTNEKKVSFPYTPVDGLRGYGYDIIVSGHIHYGFMAFDTKGKKERVLVANPGSLTRLTSYFLDKDRTPYVYVLDTDDNIKSKLSKLQPPFTMVEVPHEKDIFSEEDYRVFVSSTDSVNAFVEALHGVNMDVFYIESIIDEMAKKMSLPEEVVSCVKNYLV